MCGRYVLALKPQEVRSTLHDYGMPVSETPSHDSDDAPRCTYNFAPGESGLVYLERHDIKNADAMLQTNAAEVPLLKGTGVGEEDSDQNITYKLQTMKWGLIPSWTKRMPDYGTILKAINCRDDSLAANKEIWNSMKNKKRCVIIAQGYYEWLKGKVKTPYYIKRKDNKLFCFAGKDNLYTYTMITTNSNENLRFLHPRMPAILENGSQELYTWLDPNRSTWSTDLGNLLKPFDGELEVYPVSRDVGKISNDSPSFIIPVASSENKSNIANFFAKTKSESNSKVTTSSPPEKCPGVKIENTLPTLAASLQANPIPDGCRNTEIPSSIEQQATQNTVIEESLEMDRKRKFNAFSEKHEKRVAQTSTIISSNKVDPISSRSIKSATRNKASRPLLPNGKSQRHQKITHFFKK